MKYLIFGIVFFCGYSYAGDCNYSNVTAIQAQASNVLIRVTHGTASAWKNLGSYSSSSLTSFQSLAQQALATGASVVLRFPDGHDCKATDYSTVPAMIRINK